MQNKEMNVNFYLTKDYERNDIFAVPENKANSNPIKPNFKLSHTCQRSEKKQIVRGLILAGYKCILKRFFYKGKQNEI